MEPKMKYSELRSTIKTGDYGLCTGTQFMSKAIEFVSRGDFSHAFKFVWIGDGLWCAEEWEGVGFQLLPVSLKLQYYWDMEPAGKVVHGVATDVIRDNPVGMNFINTYRVDKKLQPYGGAKTFWDILESKCGIPHDPMKVQAVCSTFCAQYDIQCGFMWTTLPTPADISKAATSLIEIERGD